MMRIATIDDNEDDDEVDDATEVGSSYSWETSSVMTCASSVCQEDTIALSTNRKTKKVCQDFTRYEVIPQSQQTFIGEVK